MKIRCKEVATGCDWQGELHKYDVRYFPSSRIFHFTVSLFFYVDFSTFLLMFNLFFKTHIKQRDIDKFLLM